MKTRLFRIDHRGGHDIRIDVINATDLVPPDMKLRILIRLEGELTNALLLEVAESLEESARRIRNVGAERIPRAKP
jgi:hypothetical protein